MITIPESHQDILTKRSFAHVATVDADGNPQVTPVWIGYDGQYLLINSAKGRKKDRNLRERPSVALSIQDPEDPYRYLGIQGTVVETTEEGADDHINELADKYWGRPFDISIGEVRVIYRIRPDRAWTMG